MPYHVPSSPFPDPTAADHAEQIKAVRAREAAAAAVSNLGPLMQSPEFNWFMQTLVIPMGQEEQRKALDPDLPGKTRGKAVERLAVINAILEMPERMLATSTAYLAGGKEEA